MSETGKERKRGAQPGNRNALRHGLKAGKLPKGCTYIEVGVNQFRRILEDAVLETYGEISLTSAAMIQTACQWEKHARLAHRWLNKSPKKLSPTEQLNFSREVASACERRDRIIDELDLDRDAQEGVFDVLYSRVPALPAPNGSDE